MLKKEKRFVELVSLAGIILAGAFLMIMIFLMFEAERDGLVSVFYSATLKNPALMLGSFFFFCCGMYLIITGVISVFYLDKLEEALNSRRLIQDRINELKHFSSLSCNKLNKEVCKEKIYWRGFEAPLIFCDAEELRELIKDEMETKKKEILEIKFPQEPLSYRQLTFIFSKENLRWSD